MRSLRLPWRRQPDMPVIEPVLCRPLVQRADLEHSDDLSRPELFGNPDGGATIPDLTDGAGIHRRLAQIPSDGDGQEMSTRTASDTNRTHDVIGDLHTQYWRAPTDPHASPTNSSAGRSEKPSAHVAKGGVLEELEPQGDPADSDSIAALLSGERKLEDVFCQLEKGATSDLEVEPVPDPAAVCPTRISRGRRAPGTGLAACTRAARASRAFHGLPAVRSLTQERGMTRLTTSDSPCTHRLLGAPLAEQLERIEARVRAQSATASYRWVLFRLMCVTGPRTRTTQQNQICSKFNKDSALVLERPRSDDLAAHAYRSALDRDFIRHAGAWRAMAEARHYRRCTRVRPEGFSTDFTSILRVTSRPRRTSLSCCRSRAPRR